MMKPSNLRGPKPRVWMRQTETHYEICRQNPGGPEMIIWRGQDRTSAYRALKLERARIFYGD